MLGGGDWFVVMSQNSLSLDNLFIEPRPKDGPFRFSYKH